MSPEEKKQALDFFGLLPGFQPEELKKRYRELALRYHPDRGEYTSEVLFLELVRYKSILELVLEEKSESSNQEFYPKPNDEYGIYKRAKRIENDSIYTYFSKRKGEPLALNDSINPDLKVLRENLEIAVKLYRELLEKYPNTIWKRDVKESLEKIKVWWN